MLAGMNTKRPVLEYKPLRHEFELYNWPYDHNAVVKQAGFYWVPELKCWRTTHSRRAVGFIKWADEEARAKLVFDMAQSTK